MPSQKFTLDFELLQCNIRNASTKYEPENLICKYNIVVK
jgi:hypothetical protein